MSNGAHTYISRQPHPSGVSDGDYPSLPQSLLDELRGLVRGEVFARTDEEFQPLTTIFNGNVVTPSKAVVAPESSQDVSSILKFCTKHSLYPSIKAGGYGTAGWAINGDIVVDLGKLNGIDIEPPLSGDTFMSLRDMEKLRGDIKGKTKADSSVMSLSTFSGTSTSSGNQKERENGNMGKRRRSVDYVFDSGSGDLPRDPLVAKFLHGSDFPSPAVRRKLDGNSVASSDTTGPSAPKVDDPKKGDGNATVGAGQDVVNPQPIPESENIDGMLSTDVSMSTSTSISASNSASTTVASPSTAPTSPGTMSINSDKREETEAHTLDEIASMTTGLVNQSEAAAYFRRPSLPEESPLQTPFSLLSATATPHAESSPLSQTPSFSIRSEDPFGYMTTPSNAPAPVSRAWMGVPPPRGYEQPAFEAGPSGGMVAGLPSSDVPMVLDGTADEVNRSPLTGAAPTTSFLSDTATPVHPHAYVSFGAGVKQKDIDIFTAGHSLPATSSSGNVSSVAYHIPLAAHPVGSSVMLLGGFGFLSRLHGLSIDALVEVEMVLADGSIVYVNEKEHPDLWWAVRGAGPAFGVVTRYKAKAYPVPVVFAGNLIYNFHAATAASLIKHFRDCVKSAPRELYANVLLTAGPADKGSLVVVQLCYIGNKERGRKFLEAIASWDGEPCLLNEVSEKSFLGQQDSVAQILRGKAGRQWFIRSALITSLPDEIIHKTVNEFADTPIGCTWLFELAGGAVADTSDTCFPKEQREAGFTIAAFHQWELDDDDPLCVTTAEHWIEKTLAPVSTGGPYPAFLGRHEKASRIMGCFGANWDKLCEIKKRYDPHGLFRHNFWPLDVDGRVAEPCEREPKSPIMKPKEV